MGPFFHGFADELVKLSAMPAPVSVPATGRGAMAGQAATPNERIGPTNAFRNAVQPQAMISPPKPQQEAWRPTAGPKVGELTPQATKPAPGPGKPAKQTGPQDQRKPFETDIGFGVRRLGETMHNQGLAQRQAGKPAGGGPAAAGAPAAGVGPAPGSVSPRESPIARPATPKMPGMKSSPVAMAPKPPRPVGP